MVLFSPIPEEEGEVAVNTTVKETVINIRAPAARRTLIDHGAEIAGKTRTDFMLDAACEKAEELLLDRTLFVVDTERFERFQQLLDAPVNRDAFDRLMSRKAPWD
ncbi:MAG: type II toxin-antitoxin system TacA family antitoxin [Acidithiobacillus sp.]|jgi:uncharacterized protein (DUF1778 family)